MNDTAYIQLVCPHCGKRLRVSARVAGKRALCPKCNQKVEVPALTSVQETGTESAFQQRLQSLLDEYHQALSSGHALSVQDLLGRHPEAEPALAQALVSSLQQQATLDTPGTPGGPAPTLSSPMMTEGVVVALRGGQFGDFELLEELARGGMGIVFKARQKSINRVVALKMILAGTFASPEQLRRFRLEAEEAGRLDHPNIVPIYQVGEYQGQHYFAMKLIEGGTLAEWIADGKVRAGGPGRARHAKFARLIATVARAVHHAHQRGILHRDLKPGNILMHLDAEQACTLENATPMVADFGLAKHLGGTDSDTQSGAILGTPSYMAPEQAAARKDLSTAVDVYALGAILYELLTGRPPFHAATPLDTLMQVMEEEAKRPRTLNATLDRDLETICLKCLSKEPARRYGSAEELARDIDRWLTNEPIRARPASTMERARKWIRRRPAVATLLAVSAMAVLSLGLLGWFYSLRLQSAWEEAEANARKAQNNARAAEALAREAQDNARAVDDNFRKRQDATDALLIRFDRRLENVGGGAASVRLEFLHEILKMNEALLRERGHEPAIRRQAAYLQLRIGDVETQVGGNPGQPAYEKAVELFQGLVKDKIATEDDRVQLAYAYAQLGQLHRQFKRYDSAQDAYEKALQVREALAREFPRTHLHSFRASTYRFLLGDLFDEQRQAKEAEKLYRRALADQEQLVKKYPAESQYQQGLAETAGSLAVLLDRTKPDEAQQLLERICRISWEGFKRRTIQMGVVVMTGYELMDHLQRRGRHADMARFTAQFTGEFSTSPDAHYHACCYLTRAVAALKQDTALEEADSKRLSETYSHQGVEYLRRAVQLGWKDREHMFLDADLDSLRPRPDFRELMTALDRRIGQPQSTEFLVTYLTQRYVSEQGAVLAAQAGGGTVAQRKKVGASLPKPEDYVRRFIVLAEEHPKEAAAATALGEVLAITSSGQLALSFQAKQLRERAFALLERDHLETPAFAKACAILGNNPTPEGNRLLKIALEKHKLPEVRGLAGFYLARALATQTTPFGQLHDIKPAEEQLELVIRDYGGLPYGTSTLGEAAKTQLHALRHLKVGRPAEDIIGADLEGRQMKLSDFRGKVVVLDFWANWCGFCRQMYPYEKNLVRRMKNRPFALVGVNCDNDRTELDREVKRHGITWRSWWDSDSRISNRWQASGLPQIYLIDHEGVIRRVFSGLTSGSVIDAEVEALLKEVPRS
jgi:serine/threonine protein kinase/thiol-disulfide isomerase/thioredoxin